MVTVDENTLGEEAVVLCNGAFPQREDLLDLLRRSPFIVCCDGAADALLDAGIQPGAVVGDGDSIRPETRRRLGERFIHIADQETNDLSKAVHYAARLGYRSLAVLGATGKREDHALANISLLMDYHRAGIHVRMLTDYGTFLPLSGEQTIACHKGQQVSVFGFGAMRVRYEGLRYEARPLLELWNGTLNCALGEHFTVSAVGDYMVYLALPVDN